MGMTLSGGMTISGGMSAISPPPPPTGIILDPAKKASAIVLSNDNLTANFDSVTQSTSAYVLTNSQPAVFLSVGSPTVKYAAEFTLDVFTSSFGPYFFIGVGRTDSGLPASYTSATYLTDQSYGFRIGRENLLVAFTYILGGAGTQSLGTASYTGTTRYGLVWEIQPLNVNVSLLYLRAYVNGVQIGSTSSSVSIGTTQQYTPYVGVNARFGQMQATMYPTQDSMLYFNNYPVGTQAWTPL